MFPGGGLSLGGRRLTVAPFAMRSNKFASFVGFMLAGCAAENMRYQEAADTAYTQCVRASARTLALRSNETADLVAAAAAKSCPR